MYSAAAFYMQSLEVQRFNGGVFSTFRWKGLSNCQKNWAVSLPMQMCDCQDMHTSKRQRASEQFKTYCFVLFCSRQTKCQPPQSWEMVLAANVCFARSLSGQIRIWGSFPTSVADSLCGMGTVCSGQSFLVFSWLRTLPAVHDVPSRICCGNKDVIWFSHLHQETDLPLVPQRDITG